MFFSESDRKIFPYNNGVADVLGDPAMLYRRLLAETHGRPQELADKVFIDLNKAKPEEIVDACLATDRLVAIVRAVFQMAPFDTTNGMGAMDAQCLSLWREFAYFLGESKKKQGTPPMTSQRSDGIQQAVPQPTTSGSG